jgi:hypothetical protein
VDLVYFAIADTNIIKQGGKEQSEEIRWFSKKELSDPIVKINDRVRYYALKALEETSV